MEVHENPFRWIVYFLNYITGLFFSFKKIFIYLDLQRISCCMWDLIPWPEIEPRSSVLGAQSLYPLGHQRSPNKPILKMEKVQIIFTSNSGEIQYEVSGECPLSGWNKSLSFMPGVWKRLLTSERGHQLVKTAMLWHCRSLFRSCK